MESMINNAIDWDNSSNASIKMQLEELKHQQKTIKEKIIKLSENLENIEKEYFYGNKILSKRYKGVD
jgi:DNA-binding protein YbaB